MGRKPGHDGKVVNVMGLTERHWFEDEEPELTERQLEDIVYENKKAYDNGYVKGFHDAKTLEEYLVEFGVKIGFLTPEKAEQLLKEHPQIVRCKDCKNGTPGACGDGIDCDGVWHDDDWFCADGEKSS